MSVQVKDEVDLSPEEQKQQHSFKYLDQQIGHQIELFKTINDYYGPNTGLSEPVQPSFPKLDGFSILQSLKESPSS